MRVVRSHWPEPSNGGRSSKAESRAVNAAGTGSNPVGHPRLGISQEVRQWTLNPRIPGSNPGSPANTARPQPFQFEVCKIRGLPCLSTSRPCYRMKAFEVSSKRRKSFPSESQVKRGQRIVHGDKELREKLGRDDLCPCGSGRRFQAVLLVQRPVSTVLCGMTTDADVMSCKKPGIKIERSVPSPLGRASVLNLKFAT